MPIRNRKGKGNAEAKGTPQHQKEKKEAQEKEFRYIPPRASKPVKIPDDLRDELLGGGVPEKWFVEAPPDGWEKGVLPHHLWGWRSDLEMAAKTGDVEVPFCS